jgi:hypothetical protein
MDNKAGGWVIATDERGLPEHVATGFGKVFANLTGVKYMPMLYIGKQVVAGLNHAIICRADPATQGGTAYLAKVYLHEDLPVDGGEFSLISISKLPLEA